MSWVTFIWSMTAGICLTFGALHFLVWTRQRDQWATLVFSFTATAAAAYAVLDMLALRAQTPAEYGDLWRWVLALGMVESVSIAWFIRLYLRAGRLWLLWLICGVRALTLVLNFVPGPNFYFREITGLQQMPLLGELIVRPHGVLHPWAILMPPSLLLIIIFVIDAARTAARHGRHRAWVLGGLTTVGISLALVFYAFYAAGFLPSAFTGQLTLLLILVMGYELSLDVLRAGQLSRELLESQQRMQLAASAADLGLWEWDIVRDEIWATEKGRERAGAGASERINFDRFLQSVHPDDRASTQRAVYHSLEASGEFEAECRVIVGDGAIRWVVARGHVERDASGKPLRMRGVAVDVTERKHADAELLRLQGELAHVSRVSTVGQLSNTLAHELNQPLASILTNAQAAQRLLAQEPPDLVETREILADIVSEDERAGEVIRRLRALLKPTQAHLQSLSISELIEDVLRIARSDLIERDIKVHVTLDTAVPPVVGDRIQLQQVFLNLILNAGDAMVANPPADRHLTIANVHTDGTVRISVSDTGCGLPPDAERIFEPFYTTKKEGLGLGLPICRTIVSAHNGRLWAESNVAAAPSGAVAAGCGAVFHLELPIATQERP